MTEMLLAISPARGRILPLVSNPSVRKICMPPTFNTGNTANAIMIMPTPPIAGEGRIAEPPVRYQFDVILG